jgi:hypothetical protein
VVVLDILHVLMSEDKVVLVKMNPVNDYYGPLLKQVGCLDLRCKVLVVCGCGVGRGGEGGGGGGGGGELELQQQGPALVAAEQQQ